MPILKYIKYYLILNTTKLIFFLYRLVSTNFFSKMFKKNNKNVVDFCK